MPPVLGIPTSAESREIDGRASDFIYANARRCDAVQPFARR